MTTRERVSVGLIGAVIAINVAVAVWLGIDTDETNPLAYLGFGIPVALMGWWLISIVRRARARARAREGGIRGKLKVLDAQELLGGVATFNDQPFLRLELELAVPGRPKERFHRRMVVPRLAVPAVMDGKTFDVAVDPESSRRFDIEW